MKVKNKWNGRIYSVVERNYGKVTLQREDGTEFTIPYSEFMFSYIDSKKLSESA